MVKYLLGILLILFLFFGGYFFSEFLQNKREEKTKVSSEVILNQMKEVS